MYIVPSCSRIIATLSISPWAHSHITVSRCALAGKRVRHRRTVIASPSSENMPALRPAMRMLSPAALSRALRCSSVSGTSASQRRRRQA